MVCLLDVQKEVFTVILGLPPPFLPPMPTGTSGGSGGLLYSTSSPITHPHTPLTASQNSAFSRGLPLRAQPGLCAPSASSSITPSPNSHKSSGVGCCNTPQHGPQASFAPSNEVGVSSGWGGGAPCSPPAVPSRGLETFVAPSFPLPVPSSRRWEGWGNW